MREIPIIIRKKSEKTRETDILNMNNVEYLPHAVIKQRF